MSEYSCSTSGLRFQDHLRNRNVVAWLVLMTAIAAHVFDEAMTGFLPFYNSSVISLRERLGFFPAPTFSPELWLGGLVAGIILGFGLTGVVARGGRRIRQAAIALGALMILNALGHLVGSLYFWHVLPGAYSSPLLLFAAGYLILRGVRGDWHII